MSRGTEEYSIAREHMKLAKELSPLLKNLSIRQVCLVVFAFYCFAHGMDLDKDSIRKGVRNGKMFVLSKLNYRLRRYLYKNIRFLKNGHYDFLNYQVVDMIDKVLETERMKLVLPSTENVFNTFHHDYNISLKNFLLINLDTLTEILFKRARFQHMERTGNSFDEDLRVDFQLPQEKFADEDYMELEHDKKLSFTKSWWPFSPSMKRGESAQHSYNKFFKKMRFINTHLQKFEFIELSKQLARNPQN
jgi:hypothetical protein